MPLPPELYLRHETGAAVGPLSRKSIEVLYDSRVVDEGTPVSSDGTAYKTVREWPELLARMLEVKELLGLGEDPWADEPVDVTADVAADEDVHMIRVLLEAAARKVSGHLVLTGSEGELRITYKDGNIAAIETTIEALSLERFLLDKKICDAAAIAQGKERAPAMGGDLGGALISIGAVQPHEWFERLIQWARRALTGAITHEFHTRDLELADVPAPAVPLGMHRLGVMLEIVRALDKATLMAPIDDKRGCPVIPSQVEGVTIEETKPKPKELRVLNAVNGVKTVDKIFEKLGGNEEKNLPIYHALFFASQAGFVVFGDDPLQKKEREEAVKLTEKLGRLRSQNLFEVLQVNEKSTDDEVRTRYTEYAKEYHPDTLRTNAAPELLEARRQLFLLIGEAFAALETENQRYNYAHDLASGLTGGSEDLQKVQDALQSETHFKKAEILVRVKKYDEARVHIEEAIALNKADIEFQIFRTYIIYLEASRKGEGKEAAQAAIRQILALMKDNANIASGYLYLGYLHKAVDKAEVAAKYFQKVLEYDETHPEATREVRIARLREEKKKKKKRWPL